MLCAEKEFTYKQYFLFNFQLPIGLIPNGIRTYVCEHMIARPICGSLQRVLDDTLGQCISIRATGLPSSLNDFEELVLQMGFFEYETRFTEGRSNMPHNNFAVIRSSRGAESGENSLKDYDYVSAQGATKLRESVKSSRSSHSK